jgi:hypothetical protein
MGDLSPGLEDAIGNERLFLALSSHGPLRVRRPEADARV